MTDCPNVRVREVLPELARGVLAGAERGLVDEHVRGCGDCAAELAVLRAVLVTAVVPVVDTARIAAAIPAYRADGTPSGTAHRAPRARGIMHVGYLRLAAALVLGAAGVSAISVGVMRGRAGSPAAVAARAAESHIDFPGVPHGPPDGGIALIGTADLSDEGLAELVASMDRIEAAPLPEPGPVSAGALMPEGGA